MEFGIDAIDYYLPKLAMNISDLADARNIPSAKLEKGLGLKKMSIPDVDEDAASMAANALINLIQNNNIEPRSIGRIYLGTESAIDAAKPTATYAVGTVENKLENQYGERCFKNCDVVDLTFACVGAIDAIENCLDWVRANPERKAIVIASDIAKYNLESSGEYTQGAGAVAMLIKSNPNLLIVNPTIGISTRHVGDFFKPRKILSNKLIKEKYKISIKDLFNSDKQEIELFSEEPVFDGQYSNKCYQERIEEALEHYYSQKSTNFLKEWDKIVFHLPYAFQGRRMIISIWLKWLKENKLLEQLEKEIGNSIESESHDWKKAASKSSLFKEFVAKKIADGEEASSNIGNMYTASIFMSLISLLFISYKKNKDITGNKIGFLSYGSGSKSKVFEGIVASNWKDKIKKVNIFKSIGDRKIIDFKSYEDIHNNAIIDPLVINSSIVLSGIETKKNKEGFRYYS
jgi:hydroxymethylglutaryl-CoA synthase